MKNPGNHEAANPRSKHEEMKFSYLRGFPSCLRAFVVLSLFPFAGCCPHPPPHVRYDGPTLSLPDLIQQIDQNNSQITTLWASGNFECWVRDEKGKTQHIDGDKLLLGYRKPGDLRMVGEKFGAPDRLFDAGSNPRQFWMWIPIQDTMWWGEYHEGMAPSGGPIPIRPDLLTEVLGVNSIDSDLLKSPIPVLRFDGDQDVYMLTFQTLLPDRMIVQKEVWYDRATLLPRRVVFFDPNGRMLLQAGLSDHQNLNRDPKQPKIATHFDIEFLQTHTKLVLKLQEVKDSYKGRPNDVMFRFPGADAASKTYKVDDNPSQ